MGKLGAEGCRSREVKSTMESKQAHFRKPEVAGQCPALVTHTHRCSQAGSSHPEAGPRVLGLDWNYPIKEGGLCSVSWRPSRWRVRNVFFLKGSPPVPQGDRSLSCPLTQRLQMLKQDPGRPHD